MTYIICEVGSNYQSKDDALESIIAAKKCGADAVKFQMFTPEEMFGERRPLDPHGIPSDWVPDLSAQAEAVDIHWMCTAFSPEGARFLDPYVANHKIASSDNGYAQLLDAVKASGGHVFISTGGSSMGEISRTVDYFGTENLTLLYCNSEYPSTWHDLRQINVIRNKFNCDVGYSCHTADANTAITAALVYRASCVEKHFKCKEMATPDSPHSILPDQFTHMVDCIRDADRVALIPSPGERDMVRKHNRRLIATENIKSGDILTFWDNYGTYRSRKHDTRGWLGLDWHVVEGLPAKRDISKGDSIGYGDV